MSPRQPLSKLLFRYQPKPGPRCYQKMENAPWQPQRNLMSMSPRSSKLAHYRLQIAIALALVLAAASLLSIPTVRASLSEWLGLSIAPSNQVPVSAVTLVPVTPPAPTVTTAAAAVQPTRPAPSAAPSASPAQPTSSVPQPEQVAQLIRSWIVGKSGPRRAWSGQHGGQAEPAPEVQAGL